MKRGFTIVEVLLAVVILAIGLIGTSFFVYANRRNLYGARLQREATWSAVQRMEWAKGLPFNTLQIELPSGEPVVEQDIKIGHNVFAERTTERKLPDDSADASLGLWEITVAVSWGEDDQVAVSTYIYEGAP